MGGQIEELGIVGDPPGRLVGILDLTEHGGLHAVVQDLLGHAAERLEGGDVAPKHGRQILASDEPGPHQAAVAKHDREQPDDPLDLGLVERRPAEEDRRAILLDASSEGRRRLEAMTRKRSDRFDERLSGWSDDELSHFQRQLAAYNSALSDD